MEAPKIVSKNPSEINRQISEARAAVEEITLQRIGFAFMEENMALREKDPRTVIEQLVAALPDEPQIVNRADVEILSNKLILGNGRRSILDHGEVTPLESYLVFLLMTKSPKSTHLEFSEGTTADNFSITDSIRILRDQVRTKRFLQGIAESIMLLKNQKGPQEKISVCDAGCGAIPILGLYAALQNDEVEVICIENNPAAAAIAQTYIDILGLNDQVTVVSHDAREINLGKELDLLVSETMDVALLNEPMTDILHRLAPSVREGGIIIPAQVNVYGAIVPKTAYTNASEYSLVDTDAAPIVSTQWQLINTYIAGEAVPEINFNLETSHTEPDGVVLLTSEVVVSPAVPTLGMNMSRLTQPIPLPDASGQEIQSFSLRPGSVINISYSAGSHPTEIKTTHSSH